jgi:hypothetical protein
MKKKKNMSEFLIDIEYNPVSNNYNAVYSNGKVIQLGASTYKDAVLEADLINVEEYV